MSRYRNNITGDDEDNTALYGRSSRRRGGNGGDDRYESSEHGRNTGSLNERDYGGNDPYAVRGRDYGRDYERDYGRGGGSSDYGRGEYGRSHERESGGRGRYGERADYARDENYYGAAGGGYERSRGYEREDEGRASSSSSLWNEARDYVRGRSSSSSGERRGAARSHVRCRDIMTRDVTVAHRDTSLEEVARLMKDEDTGVIPVVEPVDGTSATITSDADAAKPRTSNRNYSNGKLVGLITDRDIVVRALAEGKDARTTRAEEIMTSDVHTAQPNDRVVDVIRQMGDKQVRRIPVVDGDRQLHGIISMADVALETEEDRELAGALEEISSGSSFWSKIFG
jgi:CBS domain-containing protein